MSSYHKTAAMFHDFLPCTYTVKKYVEQPCILLINSKVMKHGHSFAMIIWRHPKNGTKLLLLSLSLVFLIYQATKTMLVMA